MNTFDWGKGKNQQKWVQRLKKQNWRVIALSQLEFHICMSESCFIPLCIIGSSPTLVANLGSSQPINSGYPVLGLMGEISVMTPAIEPWARLVETMLPLHTVSIVSVFIKCPKWFKQFWRHFWRTLNKLQDHFESTFIKSLETFCNIFKNIWLKISGKFKKNNYKINCYFFY